MEQKKDLISQQEISIKGLIGEMKKEVDTARCQNMMGRFTTQLSWSEFLQLFTSSANAVLNRRGCYWDFVVDDSNTPTLHRSSYISPLIAILGAIYTRG
ncbi:MAG: hypothetical protein SNH35_08735 [Rikenellaceae bacterium]